MLLVWRCLSVPPIVLGALAWPDAPVAARSLYVSAALGSNAHGGLSPSAPLATLQYAAGVTNPGDTVFVMNGTYTNASPGGNVLFVNRSGTMTAPIVFKAYPGQHPVLRTANSWASIRVSANYIVLDGFELIGNAASISRSYGLSQASNLANPLTNGDGIDVDRPGPNITPHHVTIQNMTIHDFPGGGIAVDYADYVTVQNNVIYNTSNWSPYGDSAISIYEPQDVDTNRGIKISILHNITFNNRELVPCVCRDFEAVSDGNGIIVDDNLGTQGNNIAYGGRTLVAYNVSFGNGGSGVHGFSSAHIDILNNTAFGNELSVTPALGEIFAANASDVKILDNILVAPAGSPVISSTGNAPSVSEDYNILWAIGGGLILPATRGSHDILADPKLAAPTMGNFTLLPGSPARSTAMPATMRTVVMPEAVSVTMTDRGAE
jgi:hypothetical protein